MQVFKGQYNLGSVEAGVWFTVTHKINVYSQLALQKNNEQRQIPESTDPPQVGKHLSPRHILHHHIQITGILQGHKTDRTMAH